MQPYSEYPYTSYQQAPKKKDRTAFALVGALILFMFIGLIGGLAILLLRNAYLFS